LLRSYFKKIKKHVSGRPTSYVLPLNFFADQTTLPGVPSEVYQWLSPKSGTKNDSFISPTTHLILRRPGEGSKSAKF